jgi:FtsP/CotA-like multicopper oxidase with cupredoxin domain
VRLRNDLPVPTSTHLHGGVTPPESDGYPADLLVPAGYQANYSHSHAGHSIDPSVWRYSQQTKDYVYPNQQRAATLWYHDHRMDFTAPQMWRCLAGFALLRDAQEDRLPLPAGDRDIPS